MAPTIEHYGGHSWTPATRGETWCPGGVSVSCLASRTRHECPGHNESVYMKAWHWMWTDTIWSTVYSFEFTPSYFRHAEIWNRYAQSWIRPLSNFIIINIILYVELNSPSDEGKNGENKTGMKFSLYTVYFVPGFWLFMKAYILKVNYTTVHK